MPKKIYWFPLSPFARLVYFFAKAANIEVESVIIDLTKGQQKTPEYLAVNPHGQVPAFEDEDGFKVFESMAIIRYLSAKYHNDILPVTDPKKQALIDEHTELVKSKIQSHSATLVFQKVFAKAVFGREPDVKAIEDAQTGLTTGFGHLESSLFKESPHHVVGTSLSLADVVLGIFLSQLSIVKQDLTPFPKVNAFYQNLSTNKAFIDSHAPFFDALKAFGPK